LNISPGFRSKVKNKGISYVKELNKIPAFFVEKLNVLSISLFTFPPAEFHKAAHAAFIILQTLVLINILKYI
jgi:hypothetical protein